ncbi:Ankyrin repeat protein 2 [Giardia muris]|uniref:Ankyrin repeat protein 2 n=1 Tax=Giardia muris TaxID=5742 RepID=A0A4Z1SKS5_GIAMU|nr:Ankyrin repeat protein 2 [Giardia muris]|eukprot:TNJ26222.1 Ankyrin repeat protein 2 [Giardia muris]
MVTPHPDIIEEHGKRDFMGRTGLMRAAYEGDLATVNRLLDSEVRLQDRNGWTALMHAALMGREGCVRRLLEETGMRSLRTEAGVSPNSTALMIAARHGQTGCVRLLLEYEVGLTNSSHRTALMYASQHDHLECVTVLVEREARIRDREGQTALILAVHGRAQRVIPILLLREAKLFDKQGLTALMWAVITSNHEAVPLLLCEAGRHLKTRWQCYSTGMTALMLAVLHENGAMVELLLPYERGLTDRAQHTAQWFAETIGNSNLVFKLSCEKKRRLPPPTEEQVLLIYFSTVGDSNAVAQYLSAATTRDGTGMTALMHAARNGHRKVVALLIEKEAGIKDDQGMTALMHGTISGHRDVIELLVEHEQKIQDASGRTALMHASRNTSGPYSEKLLVEQGICDDRGWTALMHGVANGNMQYAHSLVQTEVRMRTTSRVDTFHVGATALMISAATGNLEAIKLLLEYEIYIQDDAGHSALCYAIEAGDVDGAQALVMEERLRDRKGYSPLDLGVYTDKLYVVRPLLTSLGGLGANETNLETALRLGHEGCVAILLLEEAGVYDPTWPTALMACIRTNRKDLVERFLHQAGRQNTEGWTALMYAVAMGVTETSNKNSEFMKLLLDKESGLRTTTESYDRRCYPSGITALIVATLNQNEEGIRALRESELGLTTPCGMTALMYACEAHNLAIVKLLLAEAGMETMEKGDLPKGTTALMIAAMNGFEDMVELLLPYELGRINDEGLTALAIAIQHAHYDCARLLLLEVCVRDDSSQTQYEALYDKYQRYNQHPWERAHDCYLRLKDDLVETYFRYNLSILSRGSLFNALHKLLGRVEETLYREGQSHLVLDCLETIWMVLLCEDPNNTYLETLDALLYHLEELHFDNSCIICYARQPDAVLLPCRHLLVCSLCADQIEKQCPYCRTGLDEAIVIEPRSPGEVD